MTRIREIFKDSNYQRDFDKCGYIVIPGFSNKQLQEILLFYLKRPPELSSDFYSSIDSRDFNYRTEVDSFLKSYFTPLIGELFVNYISLAANFIVKRGENSTVYDHTDHTLTDESLFTSVTIWAPLVDTNIQNGAIRVLPGSHKIPDVQRGFGIPYRFAEFADAYNDRMLVCPLKAGEALIYDPRLIHNSFPNLSGKDRPAIITGAIPQEASPRVLFRYEGMPQDEYEEFVVDTHFWNHFKPNLRPEGYKSLGIKKYVNTTITKEEFLSYLIS